MQRFLLLLILGSLSACRSGITCPPRENIPGPWISLFNGKDLSGWTAKDGTWSVEDGAIKMEQGPNQGWGWLWSERDDFRDFELELEWKGTPGNTNSGVYFRADSPDPKHRRDPKHCLQADIGIAHHEHGWGGSFNLDDVSGWLETNQKHFVVINRTAQHALKPYGEWNRYRIVADGKRVILELNGRRVVDWEDLDPKPHVHPNAVGFQDHGGPGEAGMIVWFRDIRIRKLTAD